MRPLRVDGMMNKLKINAKLNVVYDIGNVSPEDAENMTGNYIKEQKYTIDELIGMGMLTHSLPVVVDGYSVNVSVFKPANNRMSCHTDLDIEYMADEFEDTKININDYEKELQAYAESVYLHMAHHLGFVAGLPEGVLVDDWVSGATLSTDSPTQASAYKPAVQASDPGFN